MKAVHEEFDCTNCKTHVVPLSSGTRNHCTSCLCSMHVDGEIPGDRTASCHGLMRPIAVDVRGEVFRILQQCECGHQRWNKVVIDDDFEQVIAVSRKGGVTAQIALS